MTKLDTKSLYADQPCERCGSKKLVSSTWVEEIQNSLGVSNVEISQITCTNDECQAEFDKNREKELVTINIRKMAKEEQDKNRKESIAKTIAERKKLKIDLS